MSGAMQEHFESIYDLKVWGRGSGAGSVPRHCRPYRRYLERFLKERRIKSVVDVGCGDWQFSRLIDWRGIQYHGFDVAQSVVIENEARFGASNISFTRMDAHDAILPDADLLIVKDVMQHWPDAAIFRFLPTIARYRYALITNGYTGEAHKDIDVGDYRPLDLTRAPFSLPAEPVLDYTYPTRLEQLARWALRRPLATERQIVLMVKQA